jgi:hypothetical protein
VSCECRRTASGETPERWITHLVVVEVGLDFWYPDVGVVERRVLPAEPVVGGVVGGRGPRSFERGTAHRVEHVIDLGCHRVSTPR